jgi:orotate phosphoribosyltransferase
MKAVPEQIFRLLASRKGHFRLESGHHSDQWLDLEQLCLRPRDVRLFSTELVNRLAKYNIDGVCGALNEGAFLSLLVASELNVEFSYSERFDSGRDTLYPVEYRIPGTLRPKLSGKRVAIVNDVISAGSAVRSTFADLKACGAEPIAVGALLVLGNMFSRFAAEKQVALESIAFAPHNLWKPSECSLCSSNVRLENPSDSQS